MLTAEHIHLDLKILSVLEKQRYTAAVRDPFTVDLMSPAFAVIVKRTQNLCVNVANRHRRPPQLHTVHPNTLTLQQSPCIIGFVTANHTERSSRHHRWKLHFLCGFCSGFVSYNCYRFASWILSWFCPAFVRRTDLISAHIVPLDLLCGGSRRKLFDRIRNLGEVILLGNNRPVIPLEIGGNHFAFINPWSTIQSVGLHLWFSVIYQ